MKYKVDDGTTVRQLKVMLATLSSNAPNSTDKARTTMSYDGQELYLNIPDFECYDDIVKNWVSLGLIIGE